ncbi:MAG TPA: hypothetical protein VM032_12310 [Vicinamibacterales bacterium]|nr:hypothetical protein [Vicinamibacterales bacterium]
MTRRLFGSAALALALGASACTGASHPGDVAAATPAGADAAPGAASMEHGDHNPHHGGVVYMYDDMHYEVVLDPAGHHRIYFTDSARQDLPAAAASGVTLTVERTAAPPETLTGVIDPEGESWVLDGRPVHDASTSVRVAFVAKGSPYWIDVPFLVTSR